MNDLQGIKLMILPAYYTVAEVIEALEFQYTHAKQMCDELKQKHEDERKPVYKRVWFGYYKNVTPENLYWQGWSYNIHLEHYLKKYHSYGNKLTALRKLPLDAKVKLTVEEINEFFSDFDKGERHEKV